MSTKEEENDLAAQLNSPEETDSRQFNESLAIAELQLASLTTSEESETRAQFTLFPKLPTELRIRIWSLAADPQFIAFKFNGARSKTLGLLQANRESRYESQTNMFTLMDSESNIIANPTTDILHLDSTSFSSRFKYHVHCFHTILCNYVDENTLARFTRLSISMKEVLVIWKQECLHCFFKHKFKQIFPNVTEVNIILRPGPEDAEPNDMWILSDEDKRTGPNAHQHFIRDVTSVWDRVTREKPSMNIITLNFARLERWVR